MIKTPVERLASVAEKLAAKEAAKAAVVTEYKKLGGSKKLSTAQRLDRIEKFLGIAD